MTVLKRLERMAKAALAVVAARLLSRPGRRSRARELANAKRVLLVRIDDRLGEVLLTTPLFGIIKDAIPGAKVDALVHARTARILQDHPQVDRIIPFDARRLYLGPLAPGIRALRQEKYDAIVDCTNWTDPSVRSALVSRLIGPLAVTIGPAAWPVAGLYSIAVSGLAGGRNELEQRVHLLSPLASATGPVRLSFRRPRPAPSLQPLLNRLRSSPYAVVNPGGRLDWRRVPPTAFATAVQTLTALGLRAVVTWGPGEAGLARTIADLAPESLVAPETDIDELAALMGSAVVTVCNNTGPMHLSVAVGTPTLAFFLRMDPRRWGYGYPPHRMVDLTSTFEGGGDFDSAVRAEVSQFVRQLLLSPDGSDAGEAATSSSHPSGARRPPT
jgi:ADP-heptose:LPS heptosyltransferase